MYIRIRENWLVTMYKQYQQNALKERSKECKIICLTVRVPFSLETGNRNITRRVSLSFLEQSTAT